MFLTIDKLSIWCVLADITTLKMLLPMGNFTTESLLTIMKERHNGRIWPKRLLFGLELNANSLQQHPIHYSRVIWTWRLTHRQLGRLFNKLFMLTAKNPIKSPPHCPPSQRASNADSGSTPWRHHGHPRASWPLSVSMQMRRPGDGDNDCVYLAWPLATFDVPTSDNGEGWGRIGGRSRLDTAKALVRRVPHTGMARVSDSRWADSRFAPSQWETALLCNDVSLWLGTSLGSALSRETSYIYIVQGRCCTSRKFTSTPRHIWTAYILGQFWASCQFMSYTELHLTTVYALNHRFF